MTSLTDAFSRYIEENRPATHDDRILITDSGGEE